MKERDKPLRKIILTFTSCWGDETNQVVIQVNNYCHIIGTSFHRISFVDTPASAKPNGLCILSQTVTNAGAGNQQSMKSLPLHLNKNKYSYGRLSMCCGTQEQDVFVNKDRTHVNLVLLWALAFVTAALHWKAAPHCPDSPAHALGLTHTNALHCHGIAFTLLLVNNRVVRNRHLCLFSCNRLLNKV